MNKKRINDNLQDVVVDGYIDEESYKFDPDGSWTGKPKDKDEEPIQDADDL